MTKRQRQRQEEGTSNKKLHIDYSKSEIKNFFNDQIWDEKFQQQLKQDISNSQPYRWGTVKHLINDELLKNVRNEVLNEIAFTKKETDIYKVYQSGDLANLSGLDWNDLSKLPSLYKLRSAIYSKDFRDFISEVTGCGKLSGMKTDMSINTYVKGCHLLTHDDVIGSRRVSFILYLPDPNYKWKEQYGGSLRLFDSIVPNVPKTDYYCKLTPQFNQIAFFTVQPGLSFHDVEEVREDRHRLSIQGWFHIPQQGEEGYIPGEQSKVEAMSTLQQLQSKELQEFDFPKLYRDDLNPQESKIIEQELSDEDFDYLSKFLNPIYLKFETLKKLNEVFSDESVVELGNFLNQKYSEILKNLIRSSEINDITPKLSTDVKFPWKIAVPPHKQRFMYIDGKSSFELNEESINYQNKIAPQELPNFNLVTSEKEVDNKLIDLAKFLKSISFKKWLKKLTSLIVTSDQVLIRRFRPGKDFILATTTEKNLARNHQEENVLLEATLNLTPTATNPKNWESGEFGGYELCMALPNNEDGEFEDDDPAIYKSSNSDNDDSVLFTNQCKWNSLTLMVRDPSVLKFIKYVSINSKGSRWDISAQWTVKSIDEDVNN
ncbi:unnamed protein product [Candida verbasci]|uniref:uS12 prolyl 3,4-dihydroxylase n=1 Tax=Candida verbasci TaxID=1227364 RepID=A0A9W4XHL4_9ASCO|nr:unnamed protein product [Candida verbasci]